MNNQQERIDEVMDFMYELSKGIVAEKEDIESLAESLYHEHIESLVGERDESEINSYNDLYKKYLV